MYCRFTKGTTSLRKSYPQYMNRAEDSQILELTTSTIRSKFLTDSCLCDLRASHSPPQYVLRT